MSEYDVLKLAVRVLVLPPGGLVVLLVLGLVALRRRPRIGKALLTTGAALLWLLSTPWVTSALERAVSPTEPLTAVGARQVQAVVITAGGLRPHAIEFGGVTLGRLTLERVRYGARVSREFDLPILVTGGGGAPARTEADLMKRALETEFNRPVRWIENRSRNTRENAAESARLLRPLDSDGSRRIALVAHGFDMRRAQLEFEAVGFDVTPAPTHIATLRVSQATDLLPTVAAMERAHYTAYEALALIARTFD